ncbi:hypothetical protein [Nocardia sp. SYP-A9097]|uniref:hypothetical protein n=1 Tax=Nocardia sp. SYP-A9097 TaxID=2663237 RepID=UPI00129B9514|nr:hypothetical protein [Nocardia sp. SYP-A9097]
MPLLVRFRPFPDPVPEVVVAQADRRGAAVEVGLFDDGPQLAPGVGNSHHNRKLEPTPYPDDTADQLRKWLWAMGSESSPSSTRAGI